MCCRLGYFLLSTGKRGERLLERKIKMRRVCLEAEGPEKKHIWNMLTKEAAVETLVQAATEELYPARGEEVQEVVSDCLTCLHKGERRHPREVLRKEPTC
ncbi:MAG: uncharacterized protein A8A55_0976 [Amphiamblys sp. WSBS2006]|nr:MAG: uncharacterized protein A8A55_0976 [Amphiamblys sp. WSBS2006]